MSKIYFLLLSFVASISVAQISITSTNMPVSGDTARYSTASLTSVGDYTTTGANHLWDFSTIDSTGQGIRRFSPSSSTPYFFYFPFPRYGEKTLDSVPIPAFITNFLPISIKNIYSFYKKNGTTSFNIEGLGLTMSGIPVGTNSAGGTDDKLYFFPLNYLDRDSSIFSFSSPSFTSIPFTYKKSGYRITEVDGWGTITTPFGTEQCLRVVTTQYSIDTIKINSLSPPFNKFGFPNYARSYQWLTLTEKIPYLEVNGNVVGGNFVPTQARYRDKPRTFVGIEDYEQNIALAIFPNPSQGKLSIVLNYQNDIVKAEIVDLQGKTILTEELKTNAITPNIYQINTSTIAKGIYVLNLSNLKGKQSIKISVQ